jgi:hypothetical protein
MPEKHDVIRFVDDQPFAIDALKTVDMGDKKL